MTMDRGLFPDPPEPHLNRRALIRPCPSSGRYLAGEKPGVEAWDREQKTLLAKGTLITIDNQIDVTTGTVRLKAEFPNPEGKLFPNQFVNVRMVVDTRQNVVVIPSAGVQRGAQGTVVYVVKEDGTVTLRPVVVGPTEGLLTAIESGVNAGDRVITDGIDRIREGSRVEVTEATATGAPVIAPPKGRGEGKGRGDWKSKGGEGKAAAGKASGKAPEGKASEAKGPTDAPPSQPATTEADAAKREEMKKRWQSMTPEQKEEFKKRRRESQGSQ